MQIDNVLEDFLKYSGRVKQVFVQYSPEHRSAIEEFLTHHSGVEKFNFLSLSSLSVQGTAESIRELAGLEAISLIVPDGPEDCLLKED